MASPSKRARRGGSTASASDGPGTPTARQLVRGLVAKLLQHRSVHADDGAADDDAQGDDDIAPACREMLLGFRNQLPMLARSLTPHSKDADHVTQVVQLLKLLINGTVCKHSAAVFDSGEVQQVRGCASWGGVPAPQL